MAHRFVSRTSHSLPLVAALVAVAHLGIATGNLHAQTQAQKDRIWDQAEPAIMAYMEKSAAAAAQGFAMAYGGFGQWYTDFLLPALDNDPPIVKVAKLVFTSGLKLVKLLPGVGQGTGLLLDVFVFAFEAATNESAPDASTKAFVSKLQTKSDAARARALDMAQRFERDHPSDFEDAMFAYLNEELATPGIHRASDFGIGAATRKKLAALGFPEPGTATAEQLAESALASMVFVANKQHFPDRLETLDDGQRMVMARIAARRVLFPNDRARICKDAFRLGLLAPNECR